MSVEELDAKQSLTLLDEIRAKEHEIELLEKSKLSKQAEVKEINAEIKQAEVERRALINRKTPTPANPPTLPIGKGDAQADAPLDLIGIPKTAIRRLVAHGIERLPQLGELIRGKNGKLPGGLADVDGIPDATKDKIKKSFDEWVASEESAIDAELQDAQPADTDKPVGSAVPAEESPKAASESTDKPAQVKKKKGKSAPKGKAPKVGAKTPSKPSKPADRDVPTEQRAKALIDMPDCQIVKGETYEGSVQFGSFVTETCLLEEGEFELVK